MKIFSAKKELPISADMPASPERILQGFLGSELQHYNESIRTGSRATSSPGPFSGHQPHGSHRSRHRVVFRTRRRAVELVHAALLEGHLQRSAVVRRHLRVSSQHI